MAPFLSSSHCGLTTPAEVMSAFHAKKPGLFRPIKPFNFIDSYRFLMDLWKAPRAGFTVHEIPIILTQAKILSKVINRFETKLGAGRPALRWTA